MKKIPLTQNKFAFVDDEDYEWLNQWKWHVVNYCGYWYAARGRPQIFMHRLILGLEPGDKRQTDHINHNTLNNRRNNLRIATRNQNLANSKKHKNGKTSKYKGVSWNKPHRKWIASIQCNGLQFNLGYFSNEGLAARMYDIAARYFFGEFARTNFNDHSENK